MNKKCALFLLVALSIVASGGNAVAAPVTVKGTVTVEATVTGEAKEGTYDGRTTSPDDLTAAKEYVKRYSGPAEFEVDYVIVLKDDKTVDSDKSQVTFKAVFFTDNYKRGKDKRYLSNWESAPIKITGVTLKDGKVDKFTFEAEVWYPRDNRIVNKGIKGSFDLTTGESSYTATYLYKGIKDVVTPDVKSFTVKAKVKVPKPGADPQPTEFGDPDIFSPPPGSKSTCATKETGDQLCLNSPITVSSGHLFAISIDFGDLNGGAVDDVEVTVEVSSASGAELSQPYRDPENPGDFDLTWTGSPDGWVGTASLGSISGTVSAQPVFAIGNVPADDSVTITGHVDYTDDGFFESMEVLSSAGVSSETEVTPEELANEREVQIEQSDLDLSLSSNAENDLDSGDIDNGEANGGEVSLVVEQPGEPEDCHVHNSIYDSCPIEGVPLN